MKKGKGKIGTIAVLILTLVLAGIAVFTAIRLFKLRQEAVAPSAPTSKPKAQETAAPATCAALAFNLTTSTDTPTPTTTETATPTTTSTSTATPTATSTSTATARSTATATAAASLPEAGISTPTILGFSLGIVLLLVSFALVL